MTKTDLDFLHSIVHKSPELNQDDRINLYRLINTSSTCRFSTAELVWAFLGGVLLGILFIAPVV